MSRPYIVSKVYFLDPKRIQRLSPVSGCEKTRLQRITVMKLTLKNRTLNGPWDTKSVPIVQSTFWSDYNKFRAGHKTIYDWLPLYTDIQSKGYIQDPFTRHVEVAITRMGEFVLVDGRHRLVCAQELGIQAIPVELVYKHIQYKGDYK